MTRLRVWLEGLKLVNEEQRRGLVLTGGALLCLGLFLKVSWELREDAGLDSLDRAVLAFLSAHRVPALNGPAVDLTALGSVTVLALFTVIGAALLWLGGDRRASAYLAFGSAGAGVATLAFKGIFTRERPELTLRLVQVSGFSYPSGHSLAATAFYLLVMFIVWRRFASWGARAVVAGCAVAVIGGVCVSRLYLGVHYPSDVVSGACVGAAWAFFLTAWFSRGGSGGK